MVYIHADPLSAALNPFIVFLNTLTLIYLLAVVASQILSHVSEFHTQWCENPSPQSDESILYSLPKYKRNAWTQSGHKYQTFTYICLSFFF